MNNVATSTVAASTSTTEAKAPPMVTGFDSHLNAISAAGSGLNLATPKGAFDAVMNFGKSIGAPLPISVSSFRSEILRLTSLADGKGKVSGVSTKWTSGFSFSPAMKEYVKHSKDQAVRKSRRYDCDAFRMVCKIWQAYGGLSFTVDSDEE